MIRKFYGLIILGMFLISVSALAGSFSPAPSSPGASLYTLSDIYYKISAGTSAPGHTFAPSTIPNSTGITLTQLWNIIPPHRTLSAHGLDSGILNGGIYSSAYNLATIEPNLIALNIATGTSLFGVAGTCLPLDISGPLVTNFTIPAKAFSLTVNISTFIATDNIGVVGYFLTETSAAPSTSTPGWTETAPSTYTFSSSGVKNLYAWAKDAAGNISSSLNSSVVVVEVASSDDPAGLVTWFLGGYMYCNNLSGGWRLPTLDELLDIYTIGPNNLRSDYYWSGTTYDLSAYAVHMGIGYSELRTKNNNFLRVRCVR